MNKAFIIINRIICIVIMGIMPVLFTGCGDNTNTVDQQGIYYINNDSTGLYFAEYEYVGQDALSMAENTISELEKESPKLKYKTPVGSDVKVQELLLKDEQLTIDLSEKYNTLSEIDAILVRAALVMSLSRIEGIKTVSITVDKMPITDSEFNPVGPMTAESFVVNAGKEINSYEQVELTLYFANEDGSRLKKAKRTVVYNTNIAIELLVAREIIKGVGDSQDIFPLVNPSTTVISATVTDGVCYVNLSSDFLNQPYSVKREVTLYSLVNSLVELNGVNKVQIMVDGSSDIVLGEGLRLDTEYSRNLDLLE